MKFIFSNRNNKIITIILILLASFNLIYQFYSYQTLLNNTVTNGEQLAKVNTNTIATDINKLLEKIKKETKQTIDEIENTKNISSLNIKKICIKKTKEIPELLGVSISFEPFAYSRKDSLYSIYYDKNIGECMRIDTIYDYKDQNLKNSKWYTDVLKLKKPVWTKPYFGSGAKNLITDYSAPIIIDNKIIGVVSYTLSVNELMNIMHEFSLGKGSFGFIISQKGTVITHPNTEFILKENIHKILSNDPILNDLFENNSGFVAEFTNPQGTVISFAYQLLINKDWKLITVFPTVDLFQNNAELKEKLINIFVSGSLFIMLILFYAIVKKGITTSEAWFYSFSVTFILIANITFVWYLNLNNRYESHEKQDTKIINKTDLNSFIAVENSKRKNFNCKPLIEIPTGIIIEKITYEDSYNIGMSGWIWQKYLDNCSVDPQIYFPQLSPFAESNYVEKFSSEKKDGYTLVKWQFRSTFIFNFDYLKYPFNTKTLNLKLTHPDFNSNVLFTPDISGYETLNPSRLPGISIDSKSSSSSFVSSIFTIGQHKIPGNFDSKTIGKLQGIPVLQFEIKTRKPVLNALIKQFIPIILVSLMIYLLLFNIRTNKKSGKQTVGIETIAGFLFILVLSHIDFRKTVFSGSVIYLESFYFVIYFMIGFISVNIILFNLSRDYFMIRNSNKLLKLTYWPFFFLTIFIITLAIFY